jgi:hypothetical protein
MTRDLSVDGDLNDLMVARRLARCCPTSLSLEDVTTESHPISRKNKSSSATLSHFIPPSPCVVTEVSSAFRVPMPSSKHRFAFLLSDIKPIEIAKQTPKMRYELPNVKQVQSSMKGGHPVMVVSLSSDEKNQTQTENAETAAATE